MAKWLALLLHSKKVFGSVFRWDSQDLFCVHVPHGSVGFNVQTSEANWIVLNCRYFVFDITLGTDHYCLMYTFYVSRNFYTFFYQACKKKCTFWLNQNHFNHFKIIVFR